MDQSPDAAMKPTVCATPPQGDSGDECRRSRIGLVVNPEFSMSGFEDGIRVTEAAPRYSKISVILFSKLGKIRVAIFGR